MLVESILVGSLLTEVGARAYKKALQTTQGKTAERLFPGRVLVTRRGSVLGFARDWAHALGALNDVLLEGAVGEGYLQPLPQGLEAKYVLPYYQSKGWVVGD